MHSEIRNCYGRFFIFFSFSACLNFTKFWLIFQFGIVELLVVISSSHFVFKCGQGNLNLITQALAAVGCKMQVIPDPTTVHFHLPSNLSVRVHRQYGEFIAELTKNFPHEKEGILKFYNECWKVCFDWGDSIFFWAFLPLLVIFILRICICIE